MKSKLLLPIFFFVTFSASANWTPLTTGINDNLNDIYFWNDNIGVVAGSKGIYYTSTGGNGAAAWTRFAPANAGHLALYNRCKFLKMAAMPVQHKVYICGYDSVNMNSIIFDFDVDNQAFVFAHIGGANSALYDIEYGSNNKVYAVGTSGTVLRYDLGSGIIFPYPAVTSKTLRSIVMDAVASGYIDIGGDNIFIRADAVTNNLQLTSVSITDLSFSITSLATYTSIIYATGPSGIYKTNTASTGVINELTFYNEGPLHATSIVQSGQGFRYYVTTDHGVFKMYNDALEIQPPSAPYALNSIIVLEANGLAWACGGNGVILKSTNSGGGTIPFMWASVTNGCAGDNTNFFITRPNVGSATNCRVTVFDAANTEVYNFYGCALSQQIGLQNLLGDYTLRLISDNGSYSDTMFYTVNIPASPAINLPVTVSDNILCKSEKVMVNISGTQAGWNYTLYKQNVEQPVGSAVGNGGAISFESNSINQTGTYYIRVSQQSGGCKKNFTDVLPITVEHTKSRLVSQYINAFQGEQVQFHAVSNDAQFYKWTFDNSASQTTVNTKTAQVSFNSLGEKFAELQSWTSNGCYDTSVLKLTRIVSEAGLPDDCIAMNVAGEDVVNNNADGLPLLRDMKLQSDGLLIGGGSYNYIMKSATGDTLPRTDYGGVFLAKYSRKGTLRWRCYTKYEFYNCSSCSFQFRPAIRGVETMPDGSVLMAGNDDADSWLYLNGGDSVQIASPGGANDANGFVAQIGATGALQWRGTIAGGMVRQMKRDKFGNIWLLCLRNNVISYIKNGITSTVLYTNTPPGIDLNAILIKLSSTGDYISSAIIDHDGTTVLAHTNDLVIDNDGNAWVAGDFMSAAKFYNSNGSLAATALRPATTLLTSFYAVKYSASCNYLLHISGGVVTTGADSYRASRATRVGLDSLNNIYVLGHAAGRTGIDSIHFLLPGGIVRKFEAGGYFLLKLNSTGTYQWANGSKNCDYYSRAHSILTTTDKVYITSSIMNNGVDTWSGLLTSTDGNHFNMSLSNAAFLIAEYDYAGKLLRAAQSGNPTGGYLLPFAMHTDNNRLYIAGETEKFNGNPGAYSFFNQTLPTQESDGFFAVLNNDYCYTNTPVVANAGNDQTVCPGTTVTLGGAISGNNYYWTSNPAGFTSQQANPTVSPLTTTTYYLAVTNISGLIARDTVVITVNGPVANAGADKTICTGGSTTLGVAATGDTYSWTSEPVGFTSSVSNPSVSPSVNTTYFLQVTNGSCIAKDTVKVMVNTAVANAGNDRTICKGSATMIGATPPPGMVMYAWTSNPAGFISNSPQVFVTPLVNTTYYLQMTIGECVTKDTVAVTLGDPVANAGADKVICSGSSTTIGQAGAGVTYSWTSNPAGFSSALAEPVVSPAVTTTYYLVVSNALSCIARDTVIVTVTPVPPQPVITQSGAVLQSSAAAGNQWFLNGNPIAGATGVNYTPATGGSYTVQVTVNNCVSVMSVVFPYTITAIDPDPVLNSQITIGPNPVTGILTIRYSGNSALFRVTLTTVSGHIVLNETFNRTYQIDMRKYSAAVYIVQVVDVKTNKAARRIIVKQ